MDRYVETLTVVLYVLSCFKLVLLVPVILACTMCCLLVLSEFPQVDLCYVFQGQQHCYAQILFACRSCVLVIVHTSDLCLYLSTLLQLQLASAIVQ